MRRLDKHIAFKIKARIESETRMKWHGNTRELFRYVLRFKEQAYARLKSTVGTVQ